MVDDMTLSFCIAKHRLPIFPFVHLVDRVSYYLHLDAISFRLLLDFSEIVVQRLPEKAAWIEDCGIQGDQMITWVYGDLSLTHGL